MGAPDKAIPILRLGVKGGGDDKDKAPPIRWCKVSYINRSKKTEIIINYMQRKTIIRKRKAIGRADGRVNGSSLWSFGGSARFSNV
jgi:hypothetical protein